MRPPVCGPVDPEAAMNPFRGPVTGPGVAPGGAAEAYGAHGAADLTTHRAPFPSITGFNP